MNIYTHERYLDTLNDAVQENPSTHGYKKRLAEAAGCQSSFLSLVFKEKVHITPDHAIGLAQFWGLPSLEREYFMTLVNHDRASSPDLRRYHQQQLQRIRQEKEDIAKRFDRQDLEEEFKNIYYSSWEYSAIHILLTIPEFRSEEAIAERLVLPKDSIHTVLENLEKMEMIEKDDNGDWIALENFIHLPKTSPSSGDQPRQLAHQG